MLESRRFQRILGNFGEFDDSLFTLIGGGGGSVSNVGRSITLTFESDGGGSSGGDSAGSEFLESGSSTVCGGCESFGVGSFEEFVGFGLVGTFVEGDKFYVGGETCEYGRRLLSGLTESFMESRSGSLGSRPPLRKWPLFSPTPSCLSFP